MFHRSIHEGLNLIMKLFNDDVTLWHSSSLTYVNFQYSSIIMLNYGIHQRLFSIVTILKGYVGLWCFFTIMSHYNTYHGWIMWNCYIHLCLCCIQTLIFPQVWCWILMLLKGYIQFLEMIHTKSTLHWLIMFSYIWRYNNSHYIIMSYCDSKRLIIWLYLLWCSYWLTYVYFLCSSMC